MNMLLVCPRCQGELDVDMHVCRVCRQAYVVENGIPIFLSPEKYAAAAAEEASNHENSLKNFFKRRPNVYRWITRIVVPILYTGLTAKKFLHRFSADARLLNLGSGPTSLHPNALNVDLFAFPNVHIVASADALPFASESFDAVCTDQVLEHVIDPRAVVSEILRVTKKGGLIYTAVPFMYPLHPSPKDYTRWSIDGVAALFEGCQVKESGVLIGPVSGMLSVSAVGLATIFSFGSRVLQTVFTYVFMLCFSPFRFFDLLYARLPGAESTAVSVYVVVTKT